MQVNNVALSCRAALDRGVGDLQARYAALEARVTATSRQLDEVLEATGALEGEVTDEVCVGRAQDSRGLWCGVCAVAVH